MILSFCFGLPKSFNHLIYAANFVLNAGASRKIAHNCKMCIAIYSKLVGQTSNNDKSIIFSWVFERRVVKNIGNTFRFKIEELPLTYLGIFIATKKQTIF